MLLPSYWLKKLWLKVAANAHRFTSCQSYVKLQWVVLGISALSVFICACWCTACTCSHVTWVKLVIDSRIMPQWQQWPQWISEPVYPLVCGAFVYWCVCVLGMFFCTFAKICIVCVCVNCLLPHALGCLPSFCPPPVTCQGSSPLAHLLRRC